MLWTVPNLLTIVRILSIPLAIAAFYIPFPWGKTVCAIVFFGAMLTDTIDGLLARLLKQESSFGKFLDPVADKLVICSILVVIVAEEASFSIVLPAIIIICGELTGSALREWTAFIDHKKLLDASLLAKFKTFSATIALTLLIYSIDMDGSQVQAIAYALIYGTTFIVISSVSLYFYRIFLAQEGQP